MSARPESGVVERDGGVFVDDAAFAEWESERSERAATAPRAPSPTSRSAGGTSAFRPLAQIRPEQAQWLVPGRVPLGMVTLLAGDPGLGKSTLALSWAASVSTGELGGAAADVLLVGGEDSVAATIVPRVTVAGADLDRIGVCELRDKDGDPREIELPDDAATIEVMVRERGARLVVIDPLNAHLAGGVDSHKDASLRKALAPLSRIADATGAAIVVVAHLNKRRGDEPIYRVGGGIGYVGLARSALLLTRDPEDPDGESGDRRLLVHVKCNVAPLAASLIYRHEPTVVEGADDGRMIDTHRLVEVGESQVTARQALGADSRDELGADAAEAILETLSEHGACAAHEVKQRVREQVGCSQKTIERAADKLDKNGEILRETGGFPRGTTWRLASSDTTTDSPSSDNLVRADVATGENPFPMPETGGAGTPVATRLAHGVATAPELLDADALIARSNADLGAVEITRGDAYHGPGRSHCKDCDRLLIADRDTGQPRCWTCERSAA